MSDITTLSLTALRDKLARKELSAVEAASACLARIEATEPKIHALLHCDAEAALAAAKALDAAGPNPDQRLWGVPVLVKDAICVKDAPTTCGSKILENFTPFYDASCIEKMRAAGAVILGKANMDEFAMGSSTENSAYKVTANPWDLGKVPGGSSGGSAAAVAAGQCFAALGTDTGGSIRQPAAFCGTVGIKPTYGRVSRYGLVAYGSSLDQIGPLTRTADDAAAVLGVIAGPDPKDSTCAPRDVPDFEAALAGAADLAGLTIGLPDEYWGEGVDAEVRDACRAAVDTAKSLGANVVPVSLPHTPYAVATYYIVAMAEASSNLARFDGVRYGYRAPEAQSLEELYELSRSKGFGPEVQRRIVIGAYVLSAGYYDAYYRKAAQVRRLIRQDFLNAFEKCDVICGPTSPFAAFTIGQMSDDPLQMYLSDIFTISLNLAGLPGLSMPVGLGTTSAMPIGMQLFGRAFDEATILRTAKVLGNALPPLPQPAAV
ncbi:Asp-tRNA(Asn)/Glu-tRNA(Gln) amidotransferase subunit GatA [Solidesulfovibrio magneticus]|uniref:Glutamyl-tRNA(Gln) amidotransferase subunit A n=1 Tax=Solidesulfovibrio magneticus (strain ATCC 700980 / DSM 13731 / RS-1) TaxID=573370 RepID=GATA_SOLM1|nr:Asp-tRNA(Asn)/Glu-tRNA(Gln) amidotransferase subunit GatA [Solidesulfovibrio magneticus]C4XQ59.1 RecName: Full=Glutamyl-tRNA(Gln) amidotransferase subunit A; Short=Glu-ADT subunit A [Solidesulfovibrio magneticus RS-1]BAH75224.1 aspartyl/glutamyl-tRNA(Asn/Gln) amidotransferase subunit A [Solidesulfovibrio magneticus RS-1]